MERPLAKAAALILRTEVGFFSFFFKMTMGADGGWRVIIRFFFYNNSSMDKPHIKDIRQHSVQLFLSDQLQLGNILEQILDFTGPAELTVSTFSTGEEFLSKLHQLRKKGLVTRAVLYCDFKAAEKTAKIRDMMMAVYEKVYFVPNHSKVMIIEGQKDSALVMTSQNQTRGNRLENYAVFSSPGETLKIKQHLQSLKVVPAWKN